MKRGTPLRRTTPLRRRKRWQSVPHVDPRLASIGVRTLVDFPSEGKLIAGAKRRSAYRRRPRDLAYMAWIRRLPCVVRALPPDPHRLTPCGGAVEADHLGERALSRKADDRTCAPMCSQHHRERTDHSGAFRDLVREELRIWRRAALDLVAADARRQGVAA